MPLFCEILDEHFLGQSVMGREEYQATARESRTVAIAITNVALLEHCTMSSSSWMIFFIRETAEPVNRRYPLRWVYSAY